MSTRANVIIKNKNEKLYFYRHSDGYPEGTLPTLNKFMELVKAGVIRDNVSQSAGWLIILGAIEYKTISNDLLDIDIYDYEPKDWKVGAYEPTTGLHGDIEYLYIIDLDKKEVRLARDDEWKL